MHRQIGQPGLITTRQALGPDASFPFHACQDQLPVRSIAHRRGSEHIQLFHPQPTARLQGAFHGGDHPVYPGDVDRPIHIECLAKQGRLLHRMGRQGRRAGTHFDHLQLSRVRSDVQNTEQHVAQATQRTVGHTASRSRGLGSPGSVPGVWAFEQDFAYWLHGVGTGAVGAVGRQAGGPPGARP
jgi:hypothetical protein